MIRAADGTILYRDPPLTWRERMADAALALCSIGAVLAFLAAMGALIIGGLA